MHSLEYCIRLRILDTGWLTFQTVCFTEGLKVKLKFTLLSTIYCLHGYLLNQVLFANVLTVADDLSKYGCFCWICVSLPLRPFVPMGISSTRCDIGNSTISNQLVAGSIIVTHIKSITVLSLPLRVYGPMRSTHSASQGLVMASFAGSFPYWGWGNGPFHNIINSSIVPMLLSMIIDAT